VARKWLVYEPLSSQRRALTVTGGEFYGPHEKPPSSG
jgi:hypothetical protein